MGDYEQALRAAGATVHAFEAFGSYQGDWWARVSFEGAEGWVTGSYGSCSGCDAFEAEFGSTSCYDDPEDYAGRHEAGSKEGCAACATFRAKLAEFGRSYLTDRMLDQAAAEKEAGRNVEWDLEAEKMLAFVKEHATA